MRTRPRQMPRRAPLRDGTLHPVEIAPDRKFELLHAKRQAAAATRVAAAIPEIEPAGAPIVDFQVTSFTRNRPVRNRRRGSN